MFPSDSPMAMLFIAFLVGFVLVGLAPAWLRTMRRLRAFRFPFERKPPADTGATSPGVEDNPFSGYEFIVLRQLAAAGRRRLGARQLAARLLLGRAAVERALDSLLARGLVEYARPGLLERRFYLSARGRDYVVAQGFVPGHRVPDEDPGRRMLPVEERPRAILRLRRAGLRRRKRRTG